MNQLVYVANHNKTFESHVQVSSFIWENPNTFLYFPYIEMKSLLLWCIVSHTIDLINETIDLINQSIDLINQTIDYSNRSWQ